MNKSILLNLLAAITLLSSPLAYAFDESATQSLVAAVVAKNLPAIEDALRSNANPNTPRTTTLRSGTLLTTPILHTAIGQRDTAAIILLLANGANPLLENSKGDNALQLTQILLSKNPSCPTLLNIQSLLEQPANARLLDAACRGDLESADTALKAGANIEARDGEGNTPLILAVLSVSPELVELLLEKGANFKAKNNAGQTALDLLENQMTQSDKEAQDQALKRYKAAWSSTHQEPTQAQLNLALQAAARWGNVEVFNRLVSRSADLNTLTHSSLSVDPTQHRCAHNTLLHLLASRLPTTLTETERAAITQGRLDIAMALLFDDQNVLRPIAPALLAARNADGNTALHFAAMNGNEGLVSFLLTAGADATLANNAGRTPLEVASTQEIHDLLYALTPQVIMEGQEDEDSMLLAALQASLEERQPHPLSNASDVGSPSPSYPPVRIPSPDPSGASCSYDRNQGSHM